MFKAPDMTAAATIYMPREHGLPFGGNPADEAALGAADLDASDTLSRDEWARSGRSKEMFTAYDTDGSGTVSKAEFLRGRQHERAFRKRDTDGNGVLTKDEWSVFGMRVLPFDPKWLAASAAEGVRGFIGNCLPPSWLAGRGFEALDANRDGKVTAAEYVAQRSKATKVEIKPWMA
jgi:hypothetical protein